jgi:hypothetical protein
VALHLSAATRNRAQVVDTWDALDVAAAGLMGLGATMRITDRRDHVHTHEPLEHNHPHESDVHHRHAHPA